MSMIRRTTKPAKATTPAEPGDARAVRQKATRRSPAEREAEIRAAAVGLALADGLDGITLRRIASQLGVAPSLVSHYHPSMETLVAETFAAIVATEIEELRVLLSVDSQADPALAVTRFLDFLVLEERDDVTVVWLDGWSRGRRNPTLAAEVRRQMDAWQRFTHALIVDGSTSGVFTVTDPARVAWRLLGIIDGLNAHALVHAGDRTMLRRELAAIAEADLGLPFGALAGQLETPRAPTTSPPADAPLRPPRAAASAVPRRPPAGRTRAR